MIGEDGERIEILIVYGLPGISQAKVEEIEKGKEAVICLGEHLIYIKFGNEASSQEEQRGYLKGNLIELLKNNNIRVTLPCGDTVSWKVQDDGDEFVLFDGSKVVITQDAENELELPAEAWGIFFPEGFNPS